MTPELYEDRDLALQLHQVLSDIDPVRWRAEMAAKLKSRLTELQPKLQQRHAGLAGALQTELPASDSKSQWLAFKKRIQPKYTEFARDLQASSIHVPSLRPTNWSRSLLHVSSGVFGVLCLELAPHWLVVAVAAAWAVFSWSCEIARRRSPRVNALLMKAFAPVAHEHETYKVNSATWYATALILLAATNQMLWGIAGLAVLAIGDPVAGFIGRRWGRTRLVHGRTLDHPELYDFVEVSQNNHSNGRTHWGNLRAFRGHLDDRPRPLNSIKVYGADGNAFGHSDQQPARSTAPTSRLWFPARGRSPPRKCQQTPPRATACSRCPSRHAPR